eukprot:1419024-Pyramimonas_sp.AAC.1
MPHGVSGTHADGPTGGFGRAPYGARDGVLGGSKCPITFPGRMRTVPLGASVELPVGPTPAVLGG